MYARGGKWRDFCYEQAKSQLVKELVWPDGQKEATKILWFLDLLYSLDAITATENLASANSKVSLVRRFSHNICCQGLYRCLPGNLPTCQSAWTADRQAASSLGWEDISNFHPVQQSLRKSQTLPSPRTAIWTAQSYARYFQTRNHFFPCWLRVGEMQDESLLGLKIKFKKKKAAFSFFDKLVAVAFPDWVGRISFIVAFLYQHRL